MLHPTPLNETNQDHLQNCLFTKIPVTLYIRRLLY